jgi:TRAP-type C4-dicarboxylate transport system permease large subunit
MYQDRGYTILGRTPSEWLSSFPVVVLLILTLVIGTGEMIHGQLLRIGENAFGDKEKGVQYFLLRGDPEAPTCNLNVDIDAEVAKQAALVATAPPVDPNDPLADTPLDPEVVRQSLTAARGLCQEKFDIYTKIVENITPQVKAYRTLETSFFALFSFGTENRPLLLLIMFAIAAITTTLGYHHISIRPSSTQVDHKVTTGSAIVAHAVLLFSCIRYYQISSGSGVEMENAHFHFIWMALFAGLTAISVKQFLNPPKTLQKGGSLGLAQLAVPLYVTMALISGVYFLGTNNHSGLAIYINQLLELPAIFLSLALYVWAGMLLKQSRMVDLFINLLRPWKMGPELLTYIILLAAAVPTAYTGASGIFVIAAGGIIYNEIRHAGGSRQFALAATAMSGSLGVVLRPCLLVVLIAALNKQVTSSDLYHWGVVVFVLSSSMFFLASQLTRTKKSKLERPAVAIPAMMKEVLPIVPYVAVLMAVVFAYKYLMDTELNETSAPVIMPVVMLLLLIFDKLKGGQAKALTSADGAPAFGSDRKEGVENSIRAASNETIGHIGALIMLMCLSLNIGGVIERSEVMHAVPAQFANEWIAMSFILVVCVFLGMVMDPFGAVILVSGTLAPIAYANNIDAFHFWMVVLVAFELGYLSPPVALNQLLTRMVIGDEEVNKADSEVRRKGFYRRYERWILPSVVMLVSLIMVGFGPLMIQKNDALKPFAMRFMPAGQLAEASAALEAAGQAQQAAPADAQAVAEQPAVQAAASVPADASGQSAADKAIAAAMEMAAPPVAAPTAQTFAAVAGGGDANAAVESAVNAWVAAWTSKNVDGYLAAYSDNFKPQDGRSRAAWAADRRSKIDGKANISVAVEGVSVTVKGDTATVKFKQVYKSDKFNDVTNKSLTLKNEGGQWKITAEKK